MTLSRRELLLGLGSLGLGLAPRGAAARCEHPGPQPRFCFEDPPFGMGVASGDPTSEAVSLWTRLAASPLEPDGLGGLREPEINVRWALSTDAQMRKVVAKGDVAAVPAAGYSVHVRAGGLRPGTTYYYRFSTGSHASRLGRTRTTPEDPKALRFACLSCQDFNARYGAFENLARESLDFVVHLGDTIYEAALGVPAAGLAAYRNKHALFRADPQAREAWAAHPFIVTWDDHEVAADYAGALPQFDARRADGYRAFYENMPVHLPESVPAQWKDLRLFRRARFGRLLELDMLDLRQYRDPRPHDAQQALEPGRTMLGARQKQWLKRRLQAGTDWIALGSSVFMADFRGNAEAWDGYAAERWELLREVRDKGRGRVVVLSGDWHRAIVSKLVYADDGPRFAADGRVVAIEFGTPPVSSAARGPERLQPDVGFARVPQAPWVAYEDLGHRGYFVCDVTPAAWRTTYRVLKDGNSTCMTQLAAFEVRVRDGVPELTSGGFAPFAC